VLKQYKRLLFGAPIATQHAEHEKLNVPLGLAVLPLTPYLPQLMQRMKS
jgi:hypothetical protein